jgi:hypothetical protein
VTQAYFVGHSVDFRNKNGKFYVRTSLGTHVCKTGKPEALGPGIARRILSIRA